MMEKFSHTPGHWVVEPHGDTVALYSGRSGHRHGLMLMNLDDGDVNFDANARLIAAAPELLEALRDVVDAMEAEHPVAYAGELIRARAAIAKAMGE